MLSHQHDRIVWARGCQCHSCCCSTQMHPEGPQIHLEPVLLEIQETWEISMKVHCPVNAVKCQAPCAPMRLCSTSRHSAGRQIQIPVGLAKALQYQACNCISVRPPKGFVSSRADALMHQLTNCRLPRCAHVLLLPKAQSRWQTPEEDRPARVDSMKMKMSLPSALKSLSIRPLNVHRL